MVGTTDIPFPNCGLVDDNKKEVIATVLYRIADVGTEILEGSTPLKLGPFLLDKHIDGIHYPRPHIGTGDSTAPITTTTKQVVKAQYCRSNVIYKEAGEQ